MLVSCRIVVIFYAVNNMKTGLGVLNATRTMLIGGIALLFRAGSERVQKNPATAVTGLFVADEGFEPP